MRLISETGQNLSAYLAARMVFVTVLLGVAALFRSNVSSEVPYLLLLLSNITLSLGCWEWYRRHRNSILLRWITLVTAVTLDTLVLRYAGGARSEFVFLYFFSIGSAALLISLYGSLVIAGLSVAGYALLLSLEADLFMPETMLRVFIYGMNFLLAAFISSYLCEKIRRREHAHAKALGELEQTRLDTQAILDSLSTGLVTLDKNMKLLYSNPAGHKILGLSDQPDHRDIEMVFADDQPMGIALHKIIESKSDSKRLEIEIKETAGSPRTIGMTTSAFHDKKGELRGYILLFSDLTQYKVAEKTERDKERLAAIGGLARDLAHEIRNPLATVRGCVEMMNMEGQTESDIRVCGQLALKESDRLNDLLRDFLTFARLDIPVKKEGNLAQLIRHQIDERSGTVKIQELLPENLPATFDSEQMTLVIDAILLSLIEWAENDSEIKVESIMGSRSSIRFLLSKRIIPPEYRADVFRPFSNIHRKSRGLALPTASRAMHGHGGSICLDSEAGVGTWFEIEI